MNFLNSVAFAIAISLYFITNVTVKGASINLDTMTFANKENSILIAESNNCDIHDSDFNSDSNLFSRIMDYLPKAMINEPNVMPNTNEHIIKVLTIPCKSGTFTWGHHGKKPTTNAGQPHGYKLKFVFPTHKIGANYRICVQRQDESFDLPMAYSTKYSIFTLLNTDKNLFTNTQKVNNHRGNHNWDGMKLKYLLTSSHHQKRSIGAKLSGKPQPQCIDMRTTTDDLAIFVDNLGSTYGSSLDYIESLVEGSNHKMIPNKFAFHITEIDEEVDADHECGKCNQEQMLMAYCTSEHVLQGRIDGFTIDPSDATLTYDILVDSTIRNVKMATNMKNKKPHTTTTPHLMLNQDRINGCKPYNLMESFLFLADIRFSTSNPYITCATPMREWNQFLAQNREALKNFPCFANK